MNIPNVFQRHLISMNIPFKKEEGDYIYSSRRGVVLSIGVRPFPFLLSRCTNHPFIHLVI
jgi:hypothetical protein